MKWDMYEEDSFFTLGLLEAAGVLVVSALLALGLLVVARRLYRGGRTGRRLLWAAALFWVFLWLSPQVYYVYYQLIRLAAGGGDGAAPPGVCRAGDAGRAWPGGAGLGAGCAGGQAGVVRALDLRAGGPGGRWQSGRRFDVAACPFRRPPAAHVLGRYLPTELTWAKYGSFCMICKK
jgi:hypothetical protein